MDHGALRNPYAPGAGQRPPELAGRDRELDSLRRGAGSGSPAVVPSATPGPHRPTRRRQDRAAELAAVAGHRRRLCGAPGRSRAGRDQSLRRPLAGALLMAVRELAPRHRDAGPRRRLPRRCSRRSRCASARRNAKLRDRWQPGIDVPARDGPGRHRRHRGRPGRAVHRRRRGGHATSASASRCSSTRWRTSARDDLSALCAACHELSQQRPAAGVRAPDCRTCPAVAVGVASPTRATVPVRAHRPARPRGRRPRALVAPASDEGVSYEPGRAGPCSTAATEGYPYFVQAYGKVTGTTPRADPDHRRRRPHGRARGPGRTGGRLLGSATERATPAEREYLRAMAALSDDTHGVVPTSDVATYLGRKPSSLSPARGSRSKA